MKSILASFAALAAIALTGTAAHAACSLDARDVVAGSTFLSSAMEMRDAGPASVTLAHRDDARIAAIIEMRAVTPVPAQVSRAEFVAALEVAAAQAATGLRASGVAATPSVHPYDPVGWMTLTDAAQAAMPLSGHLEARLSSDCLLVADFVSPGSVNLRSRWSDLVNAVADLRNSSPSEAVEWAPDDTTPQGWASLSLMAGAPLLAVVALLLLIGRMLRLDPPGVATRVVAASGAAVAAGTLAILFPAYMAGLSEARHADGLAVLGLVAASGVAGATLGRRSALLALLSAFVGSVSVGVSTIFGWTPDGTVTGVAAAALLFLAMSGLYSWAQDVTAAKVRTLQAQAGRHAAAGGA